MGNTLIELERDVPDLEDLAAYLDGHLSAERKALVEERLLRDEDYYDVYRETMEFQQAQADEADRSGDVVAPAVWWRSWKFAPLAVAAVAATLVVAVEIPHLMLGTPPGESFVRQAFGWSVRWMLGPSTGDWVARLNAEAVIASGVNWNDPGWKRMRSVGSDPNLGRPEEVAFRIGTRTVELEIALAANSRDDAKLPAARLETLTAAGDLLLFTMPGRYTDLLNKLDTEDLDALKTKAALLETELADWFEDLEADRYVLGRWNEVGRLAARTKDAEALGGILRRRRVARGIEAIEPHIDALKTNINQPQIDFEAAEQAFVKIADALAGPG